MMSKISKPLDWAAIRVAYEAGGISIRALAREHGISHVAILLRAKEENWPRPAGARDDGRPISRIEAVGVMPVAQDVPKIAENGGHKAILQRGQDLVERLLDELAATTTHIGEIEQMIAEETAADQDGRRRHALKQAVTLSTRAGILKNLALAAKTLAEAAPGKREEAANAAKKASEGCFAVPPGPRLLARNDA